MRVAIILVMTGSLIGVTWYLLLPDESFPLPDSATGPLLIPRPPSTRPVKPASVPTVNPSAAPAPAAKPVPTPALTTQEDLPETVFTRRNVANARTVRFVDDATGAPLDGAVVHILSLSDYPFGEFCFRDGDPEDLALARGIEHRTDADGTIDVTRPHGGFAVSARHGGKWVFQRFYVDNENPAPWVARLRPDRQLHIQVVDATGKPCANVPVALKDCDDSMRSRFWQGETGPDGMAEVTHIHWRLGHGESKDNFVVTFHFPMGKPVEKRLSRDALPDVPVELVLPPTTRLRVRLTGEETLGEAEVEIASGSWSSEDPAPERTTKNGEVVFSHVDVSAKLYVGVHPKNREFPPIWSREVQWTPTAGTETVLEFTLGARHPIMVGRAVNMRGQPISECSISYMLCKGKGGWSSSYLDTDPNGRFRFILESDNTPVESRKLELEVDGAAGLPGIARAVLDLSRGFPPGETDLGDVVFQSGGHVMSGRVVDEQGSPIAGAEILVYRGGVPDPSPRHARYRRCGGSSRILDAKQPDSAPPQYDWEPENDLSRIKSDADGRFSLHAVCPPGPLRIWVGKDGYCAEMARPVRRGERDEQFVLKKAVRLTGSIRVKSDLPEWSVYVKVTGIAAAVGFFANPVGWDTPEPPEMKTATLSFAFDWDAATVNGDEHVIPFQSKDLRPGPCRVEIRVRGQPEPLHVVDGLMVQRDESRPPRLQDIDLTWRLSTAGITVENEQGNLPPGAELRIFRGTGRQHADHIDIKWSLPLEQQNERIVSRPDPIPLPVDRDSRLDVEVFAPGYRSVRLDDVRHDRRVILRPGIPVRIELPQHVPDDIDFHATIRRVRVDGRPRFLYRSDLQHVHGKEVPVSFTHRIPAPGRYQVSIYARIDEEWARAEFDVMDTESLQVFAAKAVEPKDAKP